MRPQDTEAFLMNEFVEKVEPLRGAVLTAEQREFFSATLMVYVNKLRDLHGHSVTFATSLLHDTWKAAAPQKKST